MANVMQPEKKKDLIKSNLGTIGSLVGSIYGPAGSAVGGAVGGMAAGDADKPGAQSLSAPQRRQAVNQLKVGQKAAEQAGDAESASLIQEALKRAEQKNQSTVTDGAVSRRMSRLQGAGGQ